jgi:hypothetical protein
MPSLPNQHVLGNGETRLTLEVGGNEINDPVSSSLSCGVRDNTFRVLGSESGIVARSEFLPIDIDE